MAVIDDGKASLPDDARTVIQVIVLYTPLK